MIDESNDSNKLYWTLGYEAGIELEKERIIKLFSEHYGRFDVSNNMVEGVSEQEFIEIIKREAQDD